MIPLGQDVLIASGADDSDVRDCVTSASAVAGFIGSAMSHANAQTSMNASEAGSLRNEPATFIKRLGGDTNQEVN